MKKASKTSIGHVTTRSTQKDIIRPNLWVGLVVAVIIAGFGLHDIVGSNADAKTARTGQAVTSQQVKTKNPAASAATIVVPAVLLLVIIGLLVLQLRRPKAKSKDVKAASPAASPVISNMPTASPPVVPKLVSKPTAPVETQKPAPSPPASKVEQIANGRVQAYDPGSVIKPGQK